MSNGLHSSFAWKWQQWWLRRSRIAIARLFFFWNSQAKNRNSDFLDTDKSLICIDSVVLRQNLYHTFKLWCFTTVTMSGIFIADIMTSDPGGKFMTLRYRSRPLLTERHGRTLFLLQSLTQNDLISSMTLARFDPNRKQLEVAWT